MFEVTNTWEPLWGCRLPILLLLAVFILHYIQHIILHTTTLKLCFFVYHHHCRHETFHASGAAIITSVKQKCHNIIATKSASSGENKIILSSRCTCSVTSCVIVKFCVETVSDRFSEVLECNVHCCNNACDAAQTWNGRNNSGWRGHFGRCFNAVCCSSLHAVVADCAPACCAVPHCRIADHEGTMNWSAEDAVIICSELFC